VRVKNTPSPYISREELKNKGVRGAFSGLYNQNSRNGGGNPQQGRKSISCGMRELGVESEKRGVDSVAGWPEDHCGRV
jgi:hypothetical protein